MEQSVAWKLNRTDLCRWGRNAIVFLAPLAVMYIGSVVTEVQRDGLTASDFAINSLVAGGMVLYVGNTLLDFFRKLMAGPIL